MDFDGGVEAELGGGALGFGAGAGFEGVEELAEGGGWEACEEGIEVAVGDAELGVDDGGDVWGGDVPVAHAVADGPDEGFFGGVGSVVFDGAKAEEAGEVVVEGDVVLLGACRQARFGAGALDAGVAEVLGGGDAPGVAEEAPGACGELGEDGFLAFGEGFIHGRLLVR